MAMGQTTDLGRVNFPNSGAPAAQPAFIRGLLLLHSFEYEDAAAAFQQAQRLDPDFALAYWGEAMTYNHPLWREQNLETARAVLQRLAPTPTARLEKAPTAREKGYLHAVDVLYGTGDKVSRDLAYSEAMRQLHEAYPDDLDAASLYALSILGTTQGDRDFATYMRAAAILEEVFAKNPEHPGAVHYLIHSYDDPIHAPLGLRPARIYARLAPAAAHAQHMTSHIFLALGMWPEVVKANEAAVRVMNQRMMSMHSQHRSCGHYNFWLEYGYLQEGRFKDAAKVVAGCREQAAAVPLPAPALHLMDADTSAVGSFVQMRTRYLLDTEDWGSEVRSWKVNLGEGLLFQRFSYDFASGFAAARQGDLEAARTALNQTETTSQAIKAFLDKQGVSSSDWMRKAPVIEEQQLRALILMGEGKVEEALALLRQAVAAEESMPMAFGPPEIDKPSNELLGEMLLARNRPDEAVAAFERALARAPRRALSLLGLARARNMASQKEQARAAYEDFFSVWKSADANAPLFKQAESEYAKLR
jgi:tetratricopeptide (TPR) repeat protein